MTLNPNTLKIMENKDFCAFIITHGRPDNVITFKTLQKSGYTGEVFLIVDNEDKSIEKYQKTFGENIVKVFDKKYYADLVDEGNNFDNRRTTTHARNACFDIAEQLGYKYFVVLDDDYTGFHFRFLNKERDKLLYNNVSNMDLVFNIYLDFYKKTAFKSIAFAQGGDFIGGASGSNPNVFKSPLTRKCMNSFICSTERRFWFLGQLNEDVNTYVTLGSRGDLFGTAPLCSLVQKATQKTAGGMSEAYLLYGTYQKSFTTVMMSPSSVRVSMLPSKNINNIRLHHLVKWINTVPVIIDEKHKKI